MENPYLSIMTIKIIIINFKYYFQQNYNLNQFFIHGAIIDFFLRVLLTNQLLRFSINHSKFIIFIICLFNLTHFLLVSINFPFDHLYYDLGYNYFNYYYYLYFFNFNYFKLKNQDFKAIKNYYYFIIINLILNNQIGRDCLNKDFIFIINFLFQIIYYFNYNINFLNLNLYLTIITMVYC